MAPMICLVKNILDSGSDAPNGESKPVVPSGESGEERPAAVFFVHSHWSSAQ